MDRTTTYTHITSQRDKWRFALTTRKREYVITFGIVCKYIPPDVKDGWDEERDVKWMDAWFIMIITYIFRL